MSAVWQGPHREINPGSFFYFKINDKNYGDNRNMKVYAGLWARQARGEDIDDGPRLARPHIAREDEEELQPALGGGLKGTQGSDLPKDGRWGVMPAD